MAALSQTPGRRSWSTSDVESRHALAYWVDTICSSFLEIDIDSPDRHDFHGQLTQSELGPATLYLVENATQTVRRTRARIARSRYAGYFLLQLRTGRLNFQQYGRESSIGSGDCVLVDCSAPYRLDCLPSTRSMVLRFQHDWLRNWVPAPESLAGRPFRAGYRLEQRSVRDAAESRHRRRRGARVARRLGRRADRRPVGIGRRPGHSCNDRQRKTVPTHPADHPRPLSRVRFESWRYRRSARHLQALSALPLRPGCPRPFATSCPSGDRYDEVLTPEALDFLAALHREFGPRRAELLAARRRPPENRRAGGRSDFLPRPAPCARTRPGASPRSRRAWPTPPGGDHRPDRAEDDHQRAQLGRQGLHGRLRGRQLAAPGTTIVDGQLNLIDAIDGDIDFTSPDGKHYALPREDRHARGAARAAGTCRRSTSWSTASRFRAACSTSVCTSSTMRRRLIDSGHGPVLLPAQDGEPPRGPALERRLQARPGRAGHPARHHPGHGADRDDLGRVRDGRDPLRAARPLAPA